MDATTPQFGPNSDHFGMGLTAAGYVREFSAERQDGVMSAAAQRRRIEAHVAERGWQLVSVIEDKGPDLRNWESPGLQSLLRDPSGLDKLVIVRLDRLARRARRILKLLRRLEGE